MRNSSWTAAILAGGAARRLGRIDKSALLVGTASILDRQLSLLRALTPHILIVTSERGHRRAVPAGVRCVLDRVTDAGALGGVYTALVEAPTDQVLVFACDMPFLDAAFVTYLADQGRDVDVAVPRDAGGRHPLCASYSRRAATHFRARIDAGALRVDEALEGLTIRELGPDDLVPFNRDGRLLINVNTPDDYTQARLAADGNDDAPGDQRARRPERTTG